MGEESLCSCPVTVDSTDTSVLVLLEGNSSLWHWSQLNSRISSRSLGDIEAIMLSGCWTATTENSCNCNNTSQPTVTCQSTIKKCRGMDLAVEYKKSYKRAGLPGESLFNLLSCLFLSLPANIMERIPPSKCTGLAPFGVLSGYSPTSFWTSRAKVIQQKDHLPDIFPPPTKNFPHQDFLKYQEGGDYSRVSCFYQWKNLCYHITWDKAMVLM